MIFHYNDGGRSAAGYKGLAGDCVVRAIAIAAETPYQDVYCGINLVARQFERRTRCKGISCARQGVYRQTYRRYLAYLGWRWVPTMGIGTGCTVRMRSGDLPRGRIIVALSRHLAAVVDGVLHDTADTSRGGRRCVYGYWLPPV